MKTALVIPTIREASIHKCLEEWDLLGYMWDNIIVVEDNPTKTFKLPSSYSWPNTEHYSWADINSDLDDDAWIISHHDSAIRSYGFLKAYQTGADYIFTIDDDCLPFSGCDFVRDHIQNLELTPRWVESIPNQRTRGLPYKNKGTSNNVMLSVGLWKGNPDFDSVQILSGISEIVTLPETRVLSIGQYTPICGMNMAFKREITPLCYFALSGDGVPYGRFDDIWFGVICKKICDHLGFMITCGKPYVVHSKVSDVFVNLVKEAPGIAYHESFWETIHDIPLTSKTPVGCMFEVGNGLMKLPNEYAKKFGSAITIWAGLFMP